jgi:hypothetical protein
MELPFLEKSAEFFNSIIRRKLQNILVFSLWYFLEPFLQLIAVAHPTDLKV